MNIDSKEINMQGIKCPACGSKFDYRNVIEAENKILTRYKKLVRHIKEEYGEIMIAKNTCLLGKIKELEHLYSVLISKIDIEKLKREEGSKYYKIMDMIEKFEDTNWEYQEVQNEAREDLVRAIFSVLDIEEDYD